MRDGRGGWRVGCVAAILMAAMGCEATRPADTGTVAEADRKVQERLKRVVELSAQGQPLGKIIEQLERTHSIAIEVDWKALEGEGVDPNTQVTVRLHGVPLAKVISAVLGEATNGTPQLQYTVGKGKVVISTREGLAKLFPPYEVEYDIRDMLMQPDTTKQPASYGLSKVSPSGLMVRPASEPATPTGETADDLRREIVEVIEAMVDPESWEDHGGKVGLVRVVDRGLLIRQTTANHTAIVHLLDQLRQTRCGVNEEKRRRGS